MVCFVHDRQFLHKFHAAVNQLRQSNEFTVRTLRQLPKRCCSCPEKRNERSSPAAEPLLPSMDIDALRLMCLKFELKEYIATNVLLPPLDIVNFTVLSFPTLFEPNEQVKISNHFIVQQDKQLRDLQHIHHVQLEFVRPTTSEVVCNAIAQIKYNLVAKCSSYLEAIQATYGLWVIITVEDQSHVDIVKHVLYKQWMRFIMNIDTYYMQTVYKSQPNFPQKVTKNKSSKIKRSEIKQQKRSARQMIKRQVIQETREANDECIDADECLIEEVLLMTHQRWKFLNNRFQNSNKKRQPRTHRRQHILALAMAA